MDNSDSIKNVLINLRRLTVGSNFANNLLIYGPDNVSLFKLSVDFIKTIYCVKNNGSFCNRCPQCKLISEFSHPNIKFIIPQIDEDTESNKDIVSILKKFYNNENLTINSLSTIAKYKKKQLIINKNSITNAIEFINTDFLDDLPKICLIWGPELLNNSSANSLLKTLEEPKEKCFFLLISENINKVIETIKSRAIKIFVNHDANHEVNTEDLEIFLKILRNGYSLKYENINLINEYLSKYERQRIISILKTGLYFLNDIVLYKNNVEIQNEYSDEILNSLKQLSKIIDLDFIKKTRIDLESEILNLIFNNNQKISIFKIITKINKNFFHKKSDQN